MAQADYGDAVRNAKCDAAANRLNGGILQLRNGTTVLAEIDLDVTNAFEAAGTDSAGVARALGGDGENPIGSSNPLEGVGEAAASTGTVADNARLITSGAVADVTLDVTHTSGDGAVKMVNTSIAEDQAIQVTDLRITEPAQVLWTPA